MPADLAETQQSTRQKIAARTPPGLRRLVRMALNYGHRLRTWLHVLLELKPANGRSRQILWLSFLAAPVTALSQLDGYEMPFLLDDIKVAIDDVGRFSIRARTDDLLHVLSAREPKVRRLVESQLFIGGTFVDGGANIGFYSLLAARKVGQTGKVVAFEMMPDTSAILRSHVADNSALPIQVIERALFERSGEFITASVELGKHGQASIISGGECAKRLQVRVETITLDEALAHLGPIDVLKLDLEGAEFLALSGAKSVLARTSCLIFESNHEDRRIFELLEVSGFSVERLEAFDFVARKQPA